MAQKDINDILARMIRDTSSDFVILAEYTADPKDLILELQHYGLRFNHIPKIGCQKIDMFCNFTLSQVKHNYEEDRYTIKEVCRTGMGKLIVCGVHLPDRRNSSEDSRSMFASSVVRNIERSEKKKKHSNTIVVGDFNMNPFEKGMLIGDGFNAIQCPRMAGANVERTQWGLTNKFFYNPSWRLLVEENHTAGTYFHSTPDNSLYWNVIDQVIMRPEVVPRFDKTSLKLITETSARKLVSAIGRPCVSDHLPIAFTIN